MRVSGWLLVLGCVAGAAHAGTRVLPPGAVLVDATTVTPDAGRLAIAAGEILARVESNDADAAFARLAAIADPLQQELVAARVIDALMAKPRPAGDRLLATLERVPVRVFRRHDETAADWFLPVVDVATRAKSARRVIAANAAGAAALAALMADPSAAARKIADPRALATAADSDALAAAIANLPQDRIDAVVDAITALPLDQADRSNVGTGALHADAMSSAARAGRPLVQLALRTSRVAVWTRALERAAPEDALPLFAAVDARLGEKDALQWLHAATKDARYASAAVMATGRMATRSRAASDAIDKYLGRVDTGPSAAAALVQHAGPDFVADIDKRLAGTQDTLRVQHLALALRLADTLAASKRLQALQDDPRLPAALKSELQR